MCDKWQPIETAPKDGTTILLFYKSIIRTGYYYTAYTDGYWEDSCGREIYPTHWQPLPEPPGVE